MNKEFPYKKARRFFFGPFLFLAVCLGCGEAIPDNAILMSNGQWWNLDEGESIVELDEPKVDGFAERIALFRENPELALYRMVKHQDYTYYIALPVNSSTWEGEEFLCEEFKNSTNQYHLANRQVSEGNRIIILQESPIAKTTNTCDELKKRSAIVTIPPSK